MTPLPTAFSQNLTPLTTDVLSDETSISAIDTLRDKGYEVVVGLTPEYADAIRAMCLQPSIREYCPNDIAKRFTDIQTTTSWLAGGRAAFLLLKHEDDGQRLAGYGWIGAKKTSKIPEGEATFAVRVGEADQGQGLATPFCQLVIASALQTYQVENLWLETWASNGAAVHLYHKFGFVDVTQENDTRPSVEHGEVNDTRLFMTLPKH